MKHPITLSILLSLIIFTNSCSVQKRSVQTELYFGLSQNNGNMISDSAWTAFVQKNVSTVFSEGFTIIYSEGKWLDEKKTLHAEPSRIITSVNTMTPGISARIDSLRENYKNQFQQVSVLRIDKKVSIDF